MAHGKNPPANNAVDPDFIRVGIPGEALVATPVQSL